MTSPAVIFKLLRFSTLALGLPLAVGACSFGDPYYDIGTWHPRGVTDGNLAAMIYNPHDLVEGRGTTMTDGTLAAAAVDRLYQGSVKAPATLNSSTAFTSSGNPSTPGGSSGQTP